jgi:Uma2 family endonuclease
MSKLAQPLTADEFYRMCCDGVRRELVEGEVREMPPAGSLHGWTTGRLHTLIDSHMCEHRLGIVFAAETGFIIERAPDTVRAPDIAFVRADRLPDPIPEKFLALAPDLAVETVSIDDRPKAIEEKVARWLKRGVRTVWVVDPRLRTVCVYRKESEPHLLEEKDELDGQDILPGFRIQVGEIWK